MACRLDSSKTVVEVPRLLSLYPAVIAAEPSSTGARCRGRPQGDAPGRAGALRSGGHPGCRQMRGERCGEGAEVMRGRGHYLPLTPSP
jgi:hypothetical protein